MMSHEPDYSTMPLNTVEFAVPVLRHREDPFDVVRKIAEEIGPRPVTSLAEAQTAAFVGSRLRRAGMQVWTDPFKTSPASGSSALLVALLSIGVALLWPISYAYAFACAVVTLAVALLSTSPRIRQLGIHNRESQNVIGTQPALNLPTRRVIILAPLDSHQPSDPLGSNQSRVGATTALLTLMSIELFAPLQIPVLLRFVFLLIPAAYLLVAAIAELWVRSQAHSRGAVSYAGSLAAMVTAVEDVGRLSHTEIWAVGLGGGTTGAGITELIKRYPFDNNATFFIGLEGIGRGTLSYILRDEGERHRSADSLLIELVTEATLGVQAEPSIATFASLVRPLTRANRRTISIACLDQHGKVPLQGSRNDVIESVNPALIEQTARLIANTIRALDPLTI